MARSRLEGLKMGSGSPRTIYNDPPLAHAYSMAYRLFEAIGMFPWEDKWVKVEGRFLEVAERKWPGEEWPSLLRGIREVE